MSKMRKTATLMICAKRGVCQVRVYSGRGSSQVQTKTDESRGQRFGQRLAQAGVATDWIQ